jgi:hypothetical protein
MSINLSGFDWPDDVEFEGAVRRNIALLSRLHDEGRNWTVIARAITSIGVRHKDGRDVSGKQLNTVFLRVKKELRESVEQQGARTNNDKLGNAERGLTDPIIAADKRPSTRAHDRYHGQSHGQSDIKNLGERLFAAAQMRNAIKNEFED